MLTLRAAIGWLIGLFSSTCNGYEGQGKVGTLSLSFIKLTVTVIVDDLWCMCSNKEWDHVTLTVGDFPCRLPLH